MSTTAGDKLAQLRQADQRKKRQRNLLLALSGLVILVLAAVAGMWVKSQANAASPQSSDFVHDLTHLSSDKYRKAGYSNSVIAPTKIATSSVTTTDPVSVTYFGAQYCPYCAVQRWAEVAALSRFGTFSGLKGMVSSEGNIPTIDWLHAHYSSPYVKLTTYEMSDQKHKTLQTPSKSDQANFTTYNSTTYFPGVSPGGIPFVMYGDKQYAGSGSMVDLSNAMSGQSTGDIQRSITKGTGVGKQLTAAANVITAQICSLNGGKPSTVCNAPEVKASAAHLNR